MKNKLKIIFLSGLILSLGGCTNIQNGFTGIQDKFTGIQGKFTGTPTYTEVEKTNFNVEEETQLFAMGSYKVNESGIAVANMKAKEQAEIELKKQIFNETKNILNSFFDEIHNKNVSTSKNTIEDLANLVSSELIKGAVITSSWNKEGEELVVLAIDKNIIPEKAKGVFFDHVKGIIDDLNRAVNKVSNGYLELVESPVDIIIEETPQVENIETETIEETPNSETIESNDPIDDSNIDSNAEPEVFLDDF